jgi:hypothetical protein
MWSSGQIYGLQIQSSRFDSLLYYIFWDVVDLERCSLSLVTADKRQSLGWYSSLAQATEFLVLIYVRGWVNPRA